MTNALIIRRRGLLDVDSGSSSAGDVPGVLEYERSFNAGFEKIPVSDPLTPVVVALSELLTSVPLTAYTTGRRKKVPTLVPESSVALGREAMPTAISETSVPVRETMPTLITNIEPANSTGA